MGFIFFDELTFDTQHHNGDRIYRLIEHENVNGKPPTIVGAGFQFAEQSAKKISDVENITRIQRTGRANILNPENLSNFFQETVTIADEYLLEIFDFPLYSEVQNFSMTPKHKILK